MMKRLFDLEHFESSICKRLKAILTYSYHCPSGSAVSSPGQILDCDLLKGWITQKDRVGEGQVFVRCFGRSSIYIVVNNMEDIKSLNW